MFTELHKAILIPKIFFRFKKGQLYINKDCVKSTRFIPCKLRQYFSKQQII